jgi:hypothetical protein
MIVDRRGEGEKKGEGKDMMFPLTELTLEIE